MSFNSTKPAAMSDPSWRTRLRLLLVVGMLPAALPTSTFALVPGEVNFQGLLSASDGNPVTGNVDLSFSLFAAETGGSELWSEDHDAVEVLDGIYSVSLGSINPLTPAHLELGTLYLEIQAAGETLTPRQRLLAVPYAHRATLAETVPDGAITGAKLGIPCAADEVLIKTSGGWGCSALPSGLSSGTISFPNLDASERQYIEHTIDASVNGTEISWRDEWGCGSTGTDQEDCVSGTSYNLTHLAGSRVNGWTYGMRNAEEMNFIGPQTNHVMLAERNAELHYPAVVFTPTNVSGGSFSAGNWIVLGSDPTEVTHASAYIESVDGNELYLLWQQRDGSDPIQGELITEVGALSDPTGTSTGVTAQFPDPTTVAFPFDKRRYFYWFAMMDRSAMEWQYLPRDSVPALRVGKFNGGRQGVVIGSSSLLPADNGLLVGGSVVLESSLEFRAPDGRLLGILPPEPGLPYNHVLKLPRTKSGSTLVARQGSIVHGITLGAIATPGIPEEDSGEEVCAALDENASCHFVLEFSDESSPAFAACSTAHPSGTHFLVTCK